VRRQCAFSVQQLPAQFVSLQSESLCIIALFLLVFDFACSNGSATKDSISVCDAF